MLGKDHHSDNLITPVCGCTTCVHTVDFVYKIIWTNMLQRLFLPDSKSYTALNGPL